LKYSGAKNICFCLLWKQWWQDQLSKNFKSEKRGSGQKFRDKLIYTQSWGSKNFHWCSTTVPLSIKKAKNSFENKAFLFHSVLTETNFCIFFHKIPFDKIFELLNQFLFFGTYRNWNSTQILFLYLIKMIKKGNSKRQIWHQSKNHHELLSKIVKLNWI